MPARDVLPSPGDQEAAEDTPHSGSTTYGDLVQFDFARDEATCMKCAQVLGSAHADFRYGCLVEVTSVAAAGPSRGQDYGNDVVNLRRFYCPGCSRQIDAEVAALSGPYSAFRVTSAAHPA